MRIAVQFDKFFISINTAPGKIHRALEKKIWRQKTFCMQLVTPFQTKGRKVTQAFFQRFYKEDQSRGLHARGAGLGLNICKVLVNLSGGQIRVESKQGEWCRFVFTLPVQPPNPGGMKRLPDESGRPGAVEDPASMKPVD